MSNTASWPPGYAVNPRVNTIAPELVTAFRGVPAAHASDCLGRGVGALGLNAYHGDLKLALCGPALTVRARPGDNLMIHVALQMAQPGDVIVIDGAGDLTQALIGGLMRTTAVARGVAGFIVDGAVRDIAEWAEGGVAVYARGHTHRGPSKDGPGELNVPVACAGMSVAPGDLILGDADGVLCVPAARVASLLPEVRAHAAREDKIRAGNASGKADPERFNALLRQKGCPV
ncbi:RraA family protein [Ramlibacter sp. G-1-2-2]|uniref:Putative 4-hydroxy-4-methyl-2-oxoglutarate aldolase n=1 Tax=Ramlibacter agri TaxID=2728837 RepID=A0A848HG82_9BURK|nr:RraA family protein [Ramlibacter agri]NML48439.1 RraA family protein [Ramlibacter agri]